MRQATFTQRAHIHQTQNPKSLKTSPFSPASLERPMSLMLMGSIIRRNLMS